MDHQGSYYLYEIDYDDHKATSFSQTYHASSDDNGGKVLKIGHIPPNILVDSEDDVTNPSQEGNQQKNLWMVVICDRKHYNIFSLLL